VWLILPTRGCPEDNGSTMSTARDILETAAAVAATGCLAAAGYTWAALAPTSQLFGRALTAPHNPEEIALTFDDGPNPRWTPQLLDLLARYNIRATFFLIGQFAARQRALVRQTYEAGHLIGNHTWTHPNLARTSRLQTRQELNDTNNELQQIIGARVRFFRPPFGLRRPATLTIARSLGLIPVTWNVIGNDWTDLTAEQIAARVLRLSEKNRQRGNATNLVLHDGSHRTPEADRSRTVAAVGQVLARYAKNHRFVTLDAWDADERP
jgi:peptidoglycan/xylan/chitin deacetylase (PgdA/CDA1 family)